jgi:3D (Asp-Asp-Asp) domain-containing protein
VKSLPDVNAAAQPLPLVNANALGAAPAQPLVVTNFTPTGTNGLTFNGTTINANAGASVTSALPIVFPVEEF